MIAPVLRALLHALLVCAVATSFPTRARTPRTRNGVLELASQRARTNLTPRGRPGIYIRPVRGAVEATATGGSSAPKEDVSSPASLIEEEMLQGPQQTYIAETPLKDREKAWKALDREAKKVARSAARKSSGGGGFGGMGAGKPAGGSKGSTKQEAEEGTNAHHTAFDTKVDKSRFGSVVMDQGVARINGRLAKSTAASLLDFVNQLLEDSINPKADDDIPLEELYKQQTRFADVQGKHNRWDMLMPLEESGEVMQAMFELLGENRVLTETIASILGPAPQLYELGCLVSDPGSERQLLHADYNYQPDFTERVLPPALTCFVALQDVDADMGPTTYLPKSATALHHQEIADRAEDYSSREGLLAESPNMLALLGSGDCSIYNPMMLHCGGANRSDKRRCIFYFSFKNPMFNEKDWPLAYASLSPNLRARALTLPDIHGILKDWKDNKGKA